MEQNQRSVDKTAETQGCTTVDINFTVVKIISTR